MRIAVLAIVILAVASPVSCRAADVMSQASYLREPPPVNDGISHKASQAHDAASTRSAPAWRYYAPAPRSLSSTTQVSAPANRLPDNEAGFPHQLDSLFDQEPRPAYDREFYEKQDWNRPMYDRPDYQKPVDQIDTVTKPAWNRPMLVKPNDSKPSNDITFELRPGERMPTSTRADYFKPDDLRTPILPPGDERPTYVTPQRERPMYDAPLLQAPEYLPERYLPPAAIKPQE